MDMLALHLQIHIIGGRKSFELPCSGAGYREWCRPSRLCLSIFVYLEIS
jgi:hypothetical protein